MKRNIALILLLFSCCVALFSGVKLIGIYSEYQDAALSYNNLLQHVSVDTEDLSEYVEETSGNENETYVMYAPTTTSPTEQEKTKFPTVDFDALLQINENIVAWLYIEGTEINYPIVQGEDNDFYLTHLVDGTENKSGSLFVDSNNSSDFLDMNTIIYGHNMKNGSMFATLMQYKNQSFYDQHPIGYLLTPEKNYVLEIISGHVANSSSNAWTINFNSEEAFNSWYQNAIDLSSFSSDFVGSFDDHYVTLSTCSYEYKDARFVVLAVLRDG